VMPISWLLALVLWMLYRKWYSETLTPMQERLQRYSLHLQEQNPQPTESSRGPGRAVSMGQLMELLNFFRDFITVRTAYYLDPNVIKPLTKPHRLSFSEVAGPHELHFFVSHFWGTPFSHFVKSIRTHAEVAGLEPLHDTSYWICFLSNNQWKVEEELGHGQWQESSFYKALRSGACKATCMVLDKHALPLTRSWCLFEVLQTYKLQHETNGFGGLVFCTQDGLVGSGKCYDTDVALAHRLSVLSVADATATNKGDEAMIKVLVEEEFGGMDSINDFIRGNMIKDLDASRNTFEQALDQLQMHLRHKDDDSGVLAI